MKVHSYLIVTLALLTVGMTLAGCTPPASSEPCMFTANEPITTDGYCSTQHFYHHAFHLSIS